MKLGFQTYLGGSQSIGGSYTDLKVHHEKRDPELGLTEAKISIDGKLGNEIYAGQELKVSLSYQVFEEHLGYPLDVGFGLFDQEGKGLLAFNNTNFKKKVVLDKKSGTIHISSPNFPFYRSDQVYFHFYFGYLGDYYEVLTQATSLNCLQNDFLGTGHPLNEKLNSVFVPQINFQVN